MEETSRDGENCGEKRIEGTAQLSFVENWTSKNECVPRDKTRDPLFLLGQGGGRFVRDDWLDQDRRQTVHAVDCRGEALTGKREMAVTWDAMTSLIGGDDERVSREPQLKPAV